MKRAGRDARPFVRTRAARSIARPSYGVMTVVFEAVAPVDVVMVTFTV